MNIYEKSVGRNSFIILNCAPQKDGTIHPDDKKRYKEFGDEINRRFGHPLVVVEQIPGSEVLLDLDGMKTIDYLDLWEDYRYGHRIRAYVIEGFDGQEWAKVLHASSSHDCPQFRLGFAIRLLSASREPTLLCRSTRDFLRSHERKAGFLTSPGLS